MQNEGMTRETIEKAWRVNEHGIVSMPGKFKGEMLYAPYFWDAGLSGLASAEAYNVFIFQIDDDDRRLFPELSQAYGLAVEENSQGSVTCTVFETEYGYKQELERIERIDAEENSRE